MESPLDVVSFPYNEYKFLVLDDKLDYVIDVLESLHKGSDPFPSGVVDSIYFDSPDLHFYGQCLNGEARKRKFRIRGYGDGSFHQLQLKDKHLATVRKMKDKIKPINLTGKFAPYVHELEPVAASSSTFTDMLSLAGHYGMLMPVVRVRYHRRRYRLNDYRLTLDTRVEIMGFSNGVDVRCNYMMLPHHVLEIKTADPRPYLPLLGLVQLPQVSYSKFFMGINVLTTGQIAIS